jgi:plastocyanin
MRYALFLVLLAALFPAFAAQGGDEPSVALSVKDRKFTPAELTVPAGKRVTLTIKNLDASAVEFESRDFKAEKIVPAGNEVSLHIGPLQPGTYGFFDDFHEDETKGTLVVK